MAEVRGQFGATTKRNCLRGIVDHRNSSPARGAAESIEPGVERSGTPGTVDELFKVREAADSGMTASCWSHVLSAAPRALCVFGLDDPGVERSGTPGTVDELFKVREAADSA